MRTFTAKPAPLIDLASNPTPNPQSSRSSRSSPNTSGDQLALAPNKPIHIAWKCFYTGNLQNKFLQKKNRPVIISAFTKSGSHAQPASRIVAAILLRPSDNTLEGPDAREQGRQTLHYIDAVTENITFTIEAISEAAAGKDLHKLANLLAEGSNMPLLAMAGGWLALGARAFQFSGDIMNVVGRDKEVLDMSLSFPLGNVKQSPLDTPILCAEHPENLLRDYEIRQADALIGGKWQLYEKGQNIPYHGEEPYIILQVDQHERPALQDFALHRYANELLAGWTPNDNIDFSKLLRVLKAGVKQVT